MTGKEPHGVTRIVGTFVNPIVSSVDMDAVIDQIDLNEAVERVDLDKVLDRVDVNALIDRVDLDHVLERVDLDKLMTRIDLNRLVARLDLNAVTERLDVNALIDRVDVGAVVQRVRVADIVSSTTGDLAMSAVDLARRQLVGVDAVTCYGGRRLIRRDPLVGDPTRPITGEPAGPLTRLLAFLVDLVALAAIFAGGVLLVSFLVDLFSGGRFNLVPRSGGAWWWLVVSLVAITYFSGSVVLTGRTIGKALLGLRVRPREGETIRGRDALIAVLVFPFSLVLGLGVIGIAVGKDRRALHDAASGTVVVYDWGRRRQAGLPKSVATWLARRPPPSPADGS